MADRKFPEAFKITGIEEEFLYLLEERNPNEGKTYTLMKAKKGGIEKMQDVSVKGLTLPVYLPLWKALFLIGMMEMA